MHGLRPAAGINNPKGLEVAKSTALLSSVGEGSSVGCSKNNRRVLVLFMKAGPSSLLWAGSKV